MQYQDIVVFAVVALLVIGLIFAIMSAAKSKQAKGFPEFTVEPKVNPAEIAVIKESFQYTSAGGLCIMMLLLHQVGAAVFFSSAKSAFQETSVASLWIGGNILWGLGIVLGRRRTMTVLRLPPPIA